MALSIKNPQAEKLAREVAAESGETMTQALIHALEEHLERLRGQRTVSDTVEEIMAISRRCSELPNLDQRSLEEILGYGEDGTFS